MKARIKFDDDINVTILHQGVYIKDDGLEEEYVKGEYSFQVCVNMSGSIEDNSTQMFDKIDKISVKWINKTPFRHIIEQEKIESEIIKKYQKKYLDNE